MRLVLAIAIVVAASCTAATPSTQSLPSAVASPPGVTPAQPTPSPSPAATYQVWAEEPGSRLAFTDLGLPRPQNRTAPPAADCWIFTCASGQPLGVADTDIALLPDGRTATGMPDIRLDLPFKWSSTCSHRHRSSSMNSSK